ncbi:MAG: XdhC family protein [Spirochaetales bacterium]|nr:XdhC family protein [Spirochaetales bacterium]
MDILRKTADLLDQGEDLVLVTVVKAGAGTPGKPGFKMIVARSGALHGTVGGGELEARALEEAGEMLRTAEGGLREYDLGELGMKCGGRATLLFEVFRARASFVLFGGGHIGRALSPILESLGFRVTVYDSRPEVRGLLSDGEQRIVVQGDYGDLSSIQATLAASEYCFIATHGHEHDYVVLKQVLAAKPQYRYVGLIGSRPKIRATVKRLAADGLERPPFLYAPVGLAIGGDTAAEISVSVAAEILAVRYGAAAPHMRDRLD